MLYNINQTVLLFYSMVNKSVVAEPGPESSRVYDNVDLKHLQLDVKLQQSVAYQSSKDLIIITEPNACYGQLKSTTWNIAKSATNWKYVINGLYIMTN